MTRLFELFRRYTRTWFVREPGMLASQCGVDSIDALRFGLCLHAKQEPDVTIYAGDGMVATAPGVPVASLATLLTRHFLRDGEIILLTLKPSLWYIVLSSLKVAAAVLIVVIGAHLRFHTPSHLLTEIGLFIISGRVTWAALSWMGRLYVLTDQRVVRLSGVFNTEIFECPLRRVARTRVVTNVCERALGVGSIEIIPEDDTRPCGYWQTVRHPAHVKQQISAAIRRAKMC